MNDTVATPTDTPQATACPTWCKVDHNAPHEDSNYHYSDLIHAGPVDLRLDTDTHDVTTLEITTTHHDGNGLTLDDLDALQARLTDLRPFLVAATLPAGAR